MSHKYSDDYQVCLFFNLMLNINLHHIFCQLQNVVMNLKKWTTFHMFLI